MSVLPVVSPANTVAEHVDHHNAIHVLYNDLAGGANATASPDATGSAAIAVGYNDSPVELGARASGAYSIAIGGSNITDPGAAATADDAIAVGRSTTAAHARSVAIGFNAATTIVDQIVLGGSPHQVHIPGTLRLPTGASNGLVWTSDANGVGAWASSSPARSGWHLTRVANMSVAADTLVPISWDTEIQDTPANFTPAAAGATTLTIPAGGTGLWAITFQANAGAALASMQHIFLRLVAGGFTFQNADNDDVSNPIATAWNLTVVVPLVATDTIVASVQHSSSTTPQNFTGRITAYKIGA